MKFNEKLQEMRKEKGVSQEKIAELLNVSRQAVSKWENGVGYPEIEKILFISRYFSVSLDYLFNDDLNCPEEKNELKKYSMIQSFSHFNSNLSVNQKLCVILLGSIVLISILYNLGYIIGHDIGKFIYYINH